MHTSVDRMAQVAGQDARGDADAAAAKPEANTKVNAPESSVAEESTRGTEEANDAAPVGPEDAEAVSTQEAEEAVFD